MNGIPDAIEPESKWLFLTNQQTDYILSLVDTFPPTYVKLYNLCISYIPISTMGNPPVMSKNTITDCKRPVLDLQMSVHNVSTRVLPIPLEMLPTPRTTAI